MTRTRSTKILFWLPRLLAIVFAMFLSLFATDVFSQDISFGEKILALLIHMIPTGLILAALAVAWRRSMIGGLLFIALAITFIVVSRGELVAIQLIAGPLLVIGVLFLIEANAALYKSFRNTTTID